MKVENLTKVYASASGKVVSLNNVSFSVNKGEFVSVVGPSGSGKSTLVNMLGALDRPTSGKVFLDGIDIFSLNDTQLATVRNNKLGFIFQSYNLINRTTVLKNVEFPGIIGGMSVSRQM
jgi:putative ABC transport system ATP-binding protein